MEMYNKLTDTLNFISIYVLFNNHRKITPEKTGRVVPGTSNLVSIQRRKADMVKSGKAGMATIKPGKHRKLMI